MTKKELEKFDRIIDRLCDRTEYFTRSEINAPDYLMDEKDFAFQISAEESSFMMPFLESWHREDFLIGDVIFGMDGRTVPHSRIWFDGKSFLVFHCHFVDAVHMFKTLQQHVHISSRRISYKKYDAEPDDEKFLKGTHNIKHINTCDLVDELSRREGVEDHIVEPYEGYTITVEGPARVLVVID